MTTHASGQAIVLLNRYFHPDRSATSQIASDLAFDLARHGRRVVVITSRQRYEDHEETLAEQETVAGVEIRRVWSTRFGRASLRGRSLDYLTFYLAAVLALLLQVRRGDIVIAMTDPPMASVPAWIVCRLRGARLVTWLQDLFPEVGAALGVGMLRGVLGSLLRRLRNASLRGAAANVVIGDLMAARLREEGIDTERITVIPNWADDSTILPLDHAANPLRRDWNLEGHFVVGYSGNIGRSHDCETLLAAAEILRDEPGIVFLFIGGGYHLATLKARAVTLGSERFRFQPYQERGELVRTLGAADVHWTSLLPGLEGLIVPSKFYGIAAAGRPIVHIGAADGEIARLLAQAGCGLSVSQGDGAALAAVLRALAADRSRCEEMGRRARAMIDGTGAQRLRLLQWSDLIARLEKATA